MMSGKQYNFILANLTDRPILIPMPMEHIELLAMTSILVSINIDDNRVFPLIKFVCLKTGSEDCLE